MTDAALLTTLDPVKIRRVCHVKRFLERWAADDKFRDELQRDAKRATAERSLQVDPEEIRPLWDSDFSPYDPETPHVSATGRSFQLVDEYCAVRKLKRQISEQFRQECAPANSDFRAWRDRQIARGRSEFTPGLFSAIQHPPFAIELGVGCSVGCWFCGVSAKKLSSQLRYTHDNAQLWRETLEVFSSFTGARAGSRGFLYWATDPLDNPDYEDFGRDFQEVFGAFPHTTTAQVHRHFERTRRLISFSGPRDPFLLRFSVLSTQILERIHDCFSAEELAFVEIIPQTSGSIIEKIRVGKARSAQSDDSPRNRQLASDENGRTIACVSGFLLNMVTREIKLVSPCSATDRWPNGYYVFATSRFEDASHLESTLHRMIAEHMPKEPPAERLTKFRTDLHFEELSNGFRLVNAQGDQLFEGNPFIRELGLLIDSGTYTRAAILRWFEVQRGLPSPIPESWLLDLFRAGVLDEEPH
jgi:radical SAM family RiPP maturation amino acid epimerase